MDWAPSIESASAGASDQETLDRARLRQAAFQFFSVTRGPPNARSHRGEQRLEIGEATVPAVLVIGARFLGIDAFVHHDDFRPTVTRLEAHRDPRRLGSRS